MSSWVVIAIVVVILLFIIGTFSTVHKNASMPLRKTALNDLKETLPRGNKQDNVKPSQADTNKE